MQLDAVEYLRQKMILVAEQQGSLTHPDVVAISQQLDGFIMQVQRNLSTLPGVMNESNKSIGKQHMPNLENRKSATM